MKTKHEGETKLISQGVEALIDQLKMDGVNAGRQEADSILQSARDEANSILNQARQEAKQLMDQAGERINREKQAALDALQLAARNMRLELRQGLIDRFKEEVRRVIHKELTNQDTIRQLILVLAVHTAEQLHQFKNEKIEIYLPVSVLEFDQIRNNPKILEGDPLKQLVQGITSQLLREGVHMNINSEEEAEPGIKVRIVDKDIEFDMGEDAITSLLMKHLQPRFRALLEGLL